MRIDLTLRCFGLGLAVAFGAFGCSWDTSGGPSSSGTPSTPDTPEFPGNSGQAAKTSVAYPSGPYGIHPGSIVVNFQFVGFQNASIKKDQLQIVQLADFYNPHVDDTAYAPADPSVDDRLFPAGSIYGEGTPKPKALAIDVASVWCGPCNEEAKSVLPDQHAMFKPMGGEFLLQLADSATVGKPATQKDLSNWTKKYGVDFPATIDPTYKLGQLFDANAYPANMIIDTRTMKIVEVIAGVPDSVYWTKFEKVINGT